MTEQHLDDFRVFARLEQHTRIGVPQGMEVKLVRCQSVLAHKALEYRLCAGVYEYSDEFKDFFKDKTELIKCPHVPIADTILEEACKDFKLEKPDRGWSQMNKNTYMAFQQKLKDKIMTSSNPPYGEEDGKIPFYWELMVWSKVEIS